MPAERKRPLRKGKPSDNSPSELDELTHQELRLMHDMASEAILFASPSGSGLTCHIISRAFLTYSETYNRSGRR